MPSTSDKEKDEDEDLKIQIKDSIGNNVKEIVADIDFKINV